MFFIRLVVRLGIWLCRHNLLEFVFAADEDTGKVRFEFTTPMGVCYVWFLPADEARDLAWDIIGEADESEEKQLQQDAADLRW